ncbi:MAG: hypothetical protein LKCHEGNO_02719 [Burkholderiaceae bacterium]|nr:hypothetical protein [Burkholderiaceae bacterium]
MMVLRRAVPIAVGLVVLAGCAQRPKPLYMWESFPRVQYDALLHEGVSPESQIQSMEAHADKARGANASLPPGFRAHLGMLYLATGNAEGARRMWEAESLAFPEAKAYIDSLLKRLNASAPGRPKENPT